MNARALAIAIVSLSASACGSLPQGRHVESSHAAARAKARVAVAAAPAVASGSEAAEVKITDDTAGLHVFKPGDYSVHRFSGSFRQVPLWLKEKVVERDGELSTLEYTVDENGSTSVLRVQKIGDDVFSVARVDGDEEVDIGLAPFETLMETTSFAADENLGEIDSEATTVVVGGREIPAQRTRYSVTVDGQDATLSILTSDQLPGRDIGGELTLADGTVVYRAMLVEMGSESAGENVAATTWTPDDL